MCRRIANLVGRQGIAFRTKNLGHGAGERGAIGDRYRPEIVEYEVDTVSGLIWTDNQVMHVLRNA